jgi:hypothetical protein
MGSLKQRWPARLISAVVTLALVFASSIGAYAHARAHCHHGHAHVAQHQDSEAASVSSAMEHKGESQKAPAANHADCCDTMCHGGYAIVGQASPLLAPPQSKPRIPMVRADAGAEPRSLDRPPRSSVLS